MRRTKNIEKKKKTLCKDCTKNPETCGENPLECQRKADLYFKLYEMSEREVYKYA